VLQNDDALDLITYVAAAVYIVLRLLLCLLTFAIVYLFRLMNLAIASPNNEVVGTFEELRKQTTENNLAQLAAIVEKINNKEAKQKNISKESKRSISIPNDRPIPNTACIDLGNFDNESEPIPKDFLPTILVDMDINHRNYPLYNHVETFLSPAFQTRVIKHEFPYEFINASNYCHFIACFQFMSGCIISADVDYYNNTHPDIAGVLRSYIQGPTILSPITLYLLASRIDKNYMEQQQDALETMVTFFMPSFHSPTNAGETKSATEDWNHQYRSRFTCDTCDFIADSSSLSTGSYFSLVAPLRSEVKNKTISVRELFDSYCELSPSVEWYCHCCAANNGATEAKNILYL
jgi:hypothetical protein